jgi:hypothetical protein
MDGSFKDLGGFANGAYEIKKKNNKLILRREGRVLKTDVVLSKEISTKKDRVEIIYNVKKADLSTMNSLLGIEFNMTMPDLNSDRYSYFSGNIPLRSLDNDGCIKGASSFGISDFGGEFGVRLEFSKQVKDVWYFPIKTVSQSESAYELNFQCSSIFPVWEFEFDGKKNWDLKVELVFDPRTKY